MKLPIDPFFDTILFKDSEKRVVAQLLKKLKLKSKLNQYPNETFYIRFRTEEDVETFKQHYNATIKSKNKK